VKFRYKHADEPLTLKRGKYITNGNTALIIVGAVTGEQWAVLSVNLPNKLYEGEIAIKTWSENSEIAEIVLGLGIFEDSGRRIPTGHVEASVWRIKDVKAYEALGVLS
jgi:hypothetical protein